MNLILYPRLGTNSKRGIRKTVGRFGRPHVYRPKGTLLVRLAKETGWTTDQVYNQLMRERKELTRDLLRINNG